MEIAPLQEEGPTGFTTPQDGPKSYTAPFEIFKFDKSGFLNSSAPNETGVDYGGQYVGEDDKQRLLEASFFKIENSPEVGKVTTRLRGNTADLVGVKDLAVFHGLIDALCFDMEAAMVKEAASWAGDKLVVSLSDVGSIYTKDFGKVKMDVSTQYSPSKGGYFSYITSEKISGPAVTGSYCIVP